MKIHKMYTTLFLFTVVLVLISGCTLSDSSTFDEFDATYLENPDFFEESYGITDEVKKEIWARDQGGCVHCKSQEQLGYAHKTPVDKGGKHTKENIQLKCKSCYTKTTSKKLRNNFEVNHSENPVFFEANFGITDEIKKEVWVRDQGKCAHCQTQENLGYAHKLSPKEGGKHSKDNIQLECKACHSKK